MSNILSINGDVITFDPKDYVIERDTTNKYVRCRHISGGSLIVKAGGKITWKDATTGLPYIFHSYDFLSSYIDGKEPVVDNYIEQENNEN